MRNKPLLFVSITVLVAIVYFGIFSSLVFKPQPEEEAPEAEVIITNTAQVEITKNGFSPLTLTVDQNTIVTFVNKDDKLHRVVSDPHPTHETLPALDSQTNIPPDGQYSFLFDKPGSWTYHDEENPLVFQGTIDVIGETQAGEEKLSISGLLTILWNDKPHYLLTDDQGQTYDLKINDDLVTNLGGPLVLDRKRVTVTGSIPAGSQDVIDVLSVKLI